MITTIHHNLPQNISKQVLKSVIGSLNATAIAYARGYLRFNPVENIADRVDVPTIDDYNDALADTSAATESANHSELMGFTKPMANDELCERLMVCRNYLSEKLKNMAQFANDQPLTIKETIKFQIERQPDNNDELLDALAAAVEIDAETLKAARIKMINDDRADLVKSAGKVITFLEAFDGAYHEHDQVEELFAGMPAHVQYKLIASGIRAHDKAADKAMVALLRGRLDAAAELKLIKGSKKDLIIWINTFASMNRAALDAYVERGGMLPTFDEGVIVTAETEQAARPAPKTVTQAPALTKADVIHIDQRNKEAQAAVNVEPKTVGAPRRSRTKKADIA